MADTPSITVESLLAETDWLRALARQLVRDRDRAEDLFQETVLASMRDRGSVRGPLRPWLFRVASNLASRSRRGEARRARRERAAAQPDVQVDAKDRFQMHRTVVEAVQQLEEPYHTPVLLRFFEDLPPREISKRLGVPVETVKTRLKRGMQQLRGKLDQEFGGREPWVAAILPALDFGAPAATTTVGVGGATTATGTGLFAFLPSKAILPAAALFVLGVLGWVFFGDDDVGAEPETKTVVATPNEADGAAAKQDQASEPLRRAVPGKKESPPAPAGDTVTVKVVNKATGKPAVGQLVRYQPLGAFTEERMIQMQADQRRVEDGELPMGTYFARYTSTVTTDDAGEVRVPKPENGTKPGSGMMPVFVIDGPLEGKLTLRPNQKPEHRVIELHPIVTVDVEVVDAEGEPASGVPVGWSNGRRPMFSKITQDGRAKLRLYFAFEEVRNRKGHVQINWPVFASQPVDLDELDGPVRLQLPATGSLVVTVLGEESEFLRGDGFVELLELGKRSRAVHDEFERFRRRFRNKAPTGPVMGESIGKARLKDGVARFPRVALGKRFGFRVRVMNRNKPIEGVGTGPSTVGATAKVTIRAGGTEKIVAFRVLDQDGQVLRKKNFGIRLHSTMGGGSSSFGTNLKSDDEGVVRVTVRDKWTARGARTLDLWTESLWRRKRNPDVIARVDLGRPLQPGVTKLPDVKLGAAPTIVSGVVVDGRGRPVKDVSVEVQKVEKRPGLREWATRVRGTQTIRTGKDGAFAFRGVFEGAEVRVRAYKTGRFQPAPLDVRTGTTGLKVPLPQAGALHGSFAPGLPVLRLAVGLWPQFGKPQPRSIAVTEKTGEFKAADLPPGEYVLKVQTTGVGVLFETRVTIAPGVTARPSSLQKLNLEDRVTRLRIKLVDAQGNPLPQQTVYQRTSKTGWSGIDTDAQGVAVVLGPLDGVDLRIQARGFRMVELAKVTTDRTVVLKKKIRVTVRIVGALPPDVTLHLRGKATVRRRSMAMDAAVRTTLRGGVRHATLALPEAGEYELRPSFSGRGKDLGNFVWGGTKAKVFTPAKIVVKESTGPQHFEVEIDAAQLKQALGEFDAWIARIRAAQRKR